jgi:hypothetical protein
MKIQIMGGKITEILGFKFPIRKVKKILSFLSSSFSNSFFPAHDLNFHGKWGVTSKLLKEIRLYIPAVETFQRGGRPKFCFGSKCPNVSTTPLQQWGFWQCLPFSWITLTDKHCWHSIAVSCRYICAVCSDSATQTNYTLKWWDIHEKLIWIFNTSISYLNWKVNNKNDIATCGILACFCSGRLPIHSERFS